MKRKCIHPQSITVIVSFRLGKRRDEFSTCRASYDSEKKSRLIGGSLLILLHRDNGDAPGERLTSCALCVSLSFSGAMLHVETLAQSADSQSLGALARDESGERKI